MNPSLKANPIEELEEPVLTDEMRETLMSMDADQLNLVMGLLERFGIEGVSMEELLDIRQEIRGIIRRKKVVATIARWTPGKPIEDLGEKAKANPPL
jgi:hypothetical protein